MPRLVSGVDRQGRPWTCLHLPRSFGEALNAMNYDQRVKTMRSLYADFRRSVDG